MAVQSLFTILQTWNLQPRPARNWLIASALQLKADCLLPDIFASAPPALVGNEPILAEVFVLIYCEIDMSGRKQFRF